MPKSCDVCPFMKTNDDLMNEDYRYMYCDFPYIGEYVTDYIATRHTECPLIEIPTPHGRLIDADAFSAKIIEIIKAKDYDKFYAHSLSVGEILREVVNELKGTGMDGFNNAPTIIEAEEGE